MNRYCTILRAAAVFAVFGLVWANPQPASANDAQAEPSARGRCRWFGSFECPIRLNASTNFTANFKSLKTWRYASGNGFLYGAADEKFFVIAGKRGERLTVSASAAPQTRGRAAVYVYGPNGADLGGAGDGRTIDQLPEDGDYVIRVRQSNEGSKAWRGKFDIVAYATSPSTELPSSSRCAPEIQQPRTHSVGLSALPGTTGYDFYRCLGFEPDGTQVVSRANPNIVYKLDRSPTQQRKDRYGTVIEASVKYSVLRSSNGGRTFTRLHSATIRSSMCREPEVKLIDPNAQITANLFSAEHVGLSTRCYDGASDLRGHGVRLSLSANGGRTFQEVASW